MAKKVGVLGSGIVGRTLAEGFLKHGYEVMLGTRDPAKGEVPAWVARAPGRAKREPSARPRCSERSSSWRSKGLVVEEVIEQAGPDHLTGKIVIDTTNPLTDERARGWDPAVHHRTERSRWARRCRCCSPTRMW